MEKEVYRYQKLMSDLEMKIKNGVFRSGDKMPSIRSLHRKMKLSISTVYKSYIELETMGLIEAKPKSGYFVKPKTIPAIPEMIHNKPVVREISFSSMVVSALKDLKNPNMLHFGSSSTSSEFLPVKHLSRIMKGITSEKMKTLISYSFTDGDPELKRQLVLIQLGTMDGITMDNIIVTNGCMEALTLSLMALTKRGDTILIESPVHFGLLQLIHGMGLHIIEVPVHPKTGIDLAIFRQTLEKNHVKACVIMPNFQNPTGSCMPNENKKELVNTAAEFGVVLIEDNLLSELYYGGVRPVSLKKYDTDGSVISCSSFSKTIAPGLRIGWIVTPPAFKHKILSLKAGISVSTPSLNQYILSEFLKSGAYDRFMRGLRNKLKKQTLQIAELVLRHFPKGTRIAMPEGGSLLWIQLDKRIDGLELYKTARKKHISIIPGEVCSSSGQFKHYIRLGCGSVLNRDMEKGIEILGKTICNQTSMFFL